MSFGSNDTDIFSFLVSVLDLNHDPKIRQIEMVLVAKMRDGTRLFPGIPGNQKSPGILEKVKKFWNSGKSEKILESGKTKTVV